MAAELQSVVRGDQRGLKDRIDVLETLTPGRWAAEREKIFRRAWLPVAHASDFPEPGSYRVIEVPTFRASLLVTKARDGRIQAFHNICRHRGNKLVRSGAGRRLNFACGFHGWVWGADGVLQNVPDEAQFAALVA